MTVCPVILGLTATISHPNAVTYINAVLKESTRKKCRKKMRRKFPTLLTLHQIYSRLLKKRINKKQYHLKSTSILLAPDTNV